MIMQYTPYMHRFVARLTIETTTPIAVGSGESSIWTDAALAVDCNGMPYIPGTALAGVVRHVLPKDIAGRFFGEHNPNGESHGSCISFSEGRIVGEKGQVLDGMRDLGTSQFYNFYRHLPIRQHTAITEKGVAREHSKFDEQVVPSGTRFCFEVELKAQEETDYAFFEQVMQILYSSYLRIGGGTRNGFGAFDVVQCLLRKYNLSLVDDLDAYCKKSSSLAVPFEATMQNFIGVENKNWVCYSIEFVPRNFFFFGSGFGDDEVDDVAVEEVKVRWTNNNPIMENGYPLIPATSLKGALSHRVAYYYNQQKKYYADNNTNGEAQVGTRNVAVANLFGEDGDGLSKTIKRGNVLFEDIFIPKEYVTKATIPHVKIDRFTGAAMNGALFAEKVCYLTTSQPFSTEIWLNKQAVTDADVLCSFEAALKDLCGGNLPLGGHVNRGYGALEGKICRDGEPLTWGE